MSSKVAARVSRKLDGLNVLIVEDEIDTRELLAALFSHQGANVLQAGSTREALRLFDSTRIDLLLSDIGMPGDDGYALISKLREDGTKASASPPSPSPPTPATKTARARSPRVSSSTSPNPSIRKRC